MRAKLITAAVVLSIVGVLTFFLVRATPRETLARLAPQTTVAWIEAQNLQDLLEAVEAHEDLGPAFQGSSTHKAALELWSMLEQLASGPDSPLEGTDLELSRSLLLHALGQDLAWGLTAPADNAPGFVAFSKLNLVGLAQDTGSANPDTLRATFETLLTNAGFTLADPYRDVPYATQPRGPYTITVGVADDVVIVTSDVDTFQQCVDIHHQDTPSLAASNRFRNEVAKLPRGPLFTWLDLDFVRDTQRVEHSVHAFLDVLETAGVSKRDLQTPRRFKAAWLDVLAQDLHPDAHGVAGGLSVPQGDLYAFDVHYSRSDVELFANSSTDPRVLAPADACLFLQTTDLGDLWERFRTSEAYRALTHMDMVTWVRDTAQNPQAIAGLIPNATPDVPLENTFEVDLIVRYIELQTTEALRHDTSFAFALRDGDDPLQRVHPQLTLRTRPGTRALLDLLLGALDAERDDLPMIARSQHQGTTIYSLEAAPDVHVNVAKHGPQLIVTLHHDDLTQALTRADQGQGGLSTHPSFTDLVERLPQPAYAFGYVHTAPLLDLAHELIAQLPPEAQSPVTEAVDRFAGTLESGGMALGVNDDCTVWTFKTFNRFPENVSDETLALHPAADSEPAAWSYFPPNTFASSVSEFDLDPFVDMVRTQLAELPDAQAELDETLARAEQRLGTDVWTFIDALGSSMGLALTPQPKVVPDNLPPAAAQDLVTLPGALLVLQLDDPDLVRQSLLQGIESLVAQTDGDLALTEHTIGSHTAYSILGPDAQRNLGPTGVSFSPMFTVADGVLILASSRATLEASLVAHQDGNNLANAPSLRKLTDLVGTRELPTALHADMDGVVDAALVNLDVLARNMPMPAPEHLSPPDYPDYSSIAWDDPKYEERLRALDDAYDQANAEYHRKLQAWKDAHADERKDTLRANLDSLRTLGDLIYTVRRVEREGVESTAIYTIQLPTSE